MADYSVPIHLTCTYMHVYIPCHTTLLGCTYSYLGCNVTGKDGHVILWYRHTESCIYVGVCINNDNLMTLLFKHYQQLALILLGKVPSEPQNKMEFFRFLAVMLLTGGEECFSIAIPDVL